MSVRNEVNELKREMEIKPVIIFLIPQVTTITFCVLFFVHDSSPTIYILINNFEKLDHWIVQFESFPWPSHRGV